MCWVRHRCCRSCWNYCWSCCGSKARQQLGSASHVKRECRENVQDIRAVSVSATKQQNVCTDHLWCSSTIIVSYLSSFASGLPCDGDTTGVVCSFLFSSEGLSPPPGSSGEQMMKREQMRHTKEVNIKTRIIQTAQDYCTKTSSINI